MKLFKNNITVNNQKKGLTYDPVFYAALRELAHDPVVCQMKRYPHHGSTDCFRHCLHVAYFNYKICRALNLDYKAGVRAGMLHDLFLYDWHTHGKETGEQWRKEERTLSPSRVLIQQIPADNASAG